MLRLGVRSKIGFDTVADEAEDMGCFTTVPVQQCFGAD